MCGLCLCLCPLWGSALGLGWRPILDSKVGDLYEFETTRMRGEGTLKTLEKLRADFLDGCGVTKILIKAVGEGISGGLRGIILKQEVGAEGVRTPWEQNRTYDCSCRGQQLRHSPEAITASHNC